MLILLIHTVNPAKSNLLVFPPKLNLPNPNINGPFRVDLHKG